MIRTLLQASSCYNNFKRFFFQFVHIRQQSAVFGEAQHYEIMRLYLSKIYRSFPFRKSRFPTYDCVASPVSLYTSHAPVAERKNTYNVCKKQYLLLFKQPFLVKQNLHTILQQNNYISQFISGLLS